MSFVSPDLDMKMSKWMVEYHLEMTDVSEALRKKGVTISSTDDLILALLEEGLSVLLETDPRHK